MTPPGGTAPIAHGWIRHGRGRLNLAMRLAARAHAALSTSGAARGPLRLAANGASAAADVGLSRRLGRSDRAELVLHAAIDAADLALWTALSTDSGERQLATSVGIGHPLAIEAGARYGWRGLGVPAGSMAITAAVNRARKRPTPPAPFAWQIAAALGGIGLARYARGLRRRRLTVHERQLEAELHRVELTAANDVTIGLDNLMDDVQRAEVLVRLGASVTSTREPWKADLADRTRRSHRYLVDVLVGWQQRHNQASDLRGVVDLALAPDLAPVVLAGAQAEVLEGRLDALDLHGRVEVRPAAGAGAVSGTSVSVALLVGDHRLEVETGLEPVRLGFDPVPGGFAWMALWLAAAAPQDGVPASAALGPAGGALGLMLWTHRSSQQDNARHDAAILASTLLAIAAAVVQTRTATAPRDAPGLPRVPVSLGLRGLAFVTALARPRTSPATTAAALAGGGVAATLAWRCTPHPRPIRELAAELSWVAMSATMARSFTEGIERDGADLERWVAGEDAARRVDSERLGRGRALDAVREALDAADRLYDDHAERLDHDVRVEARRRLDACRERLAVAS